MVGRGALLTVAATGAAGAVGLGVWTWFLAGRSLDVMDQWSSVMSSFGTLLSLLFAVVGLILTVRDSGTSGGGTGAGRRSFRARNASGARVTFGDHSSISDRDR